MDDFIKRTELTWKNKKSAAQWRASLGAHAALLMSRPVDRIDTNDVIAVLDPIWHRLPETAKRVRGRIEAIMSMAKTRGFRSGENPAAWRGNLKNVFPAKPKLVRGHFKAMDHEEIPAFMARLRTADSMSALALEWIILTALRPSVGVSAHWSEIDRHNRTWTIRAERMKGDKEAALVNEDHVVPLCRRALDILDRVEALRVTKWGAGPAIRRDRIKGCPRQGHPVADEDEIGGPTTGLMSCRRGNSTGRSGRAAIAFRSLMAPTRSEPARGPGPIAVGTCLCPKPRPPLLRPRSSSRWKRSRRFSVSHAQR